MQYPNHKNMLINCHFKVAVLLLMSCFVSLRGWSQSKTNEKAVEPYAAYLFAYFEGRGANTEAIRFGLSSDGYHFYALNGNQPVLDNAKISSTGGVRDPHILRGIDGKTFYMVATDMHVAKNGWNPNTAMLLMTSTNLIDWKSSIVNIPAAFEAFKDVNRVWAPETIYDKKAGKYMLYWSMRTGQQADIIYYAYANKDFTALESEPKQLLFSPTKGACIDGDIVERNGRFHLFFKTESEGAKIRQAISDHLTGGYEVQQGIVQLTKEPAEGVGVYKLNNEDGYILMYDVYKNGRYEFTKSKDLEHFTLVKDMSLDFHPRHGSVISLTSTEAERLASHWMTADQVVSGVKGKDIKMRNVALDTNNHSLTLPVKPETVLKTFAPKFPNLPGIEVYRLTKAGFDKGAVHYGVKIGDRPAVNYSVKAVKWHNPVIEGYFADPDILYSKKTGKYYLYPTSDGFKGWSGTYFKAFSSTDLVNWKDEGVILDLKKDVSWAHERAWAPCIIEKKINGRYKYFYYFVAAGKIGVAVSDDPAGPFKDSGKPLIDKYPPGIHRGQQIDPDVFTDPKTGKSYLYWGNGYLAGAVLNADMVSIDTTTIKVLKTDKTYREGAYVIYRDGKYYFMWSSNDTRSPDYQVHYGVADQPLGSIAIPAENLVLAKDRSKGIYGTGHHSVLQIPGTDEWYIVYHRFTYPKGIQMGSDAGFYREVCIDRLNFDKEGRIMQVKPTLKGIEPLKRK